MVGCWQVLTLHHATPFQLETECAKEMMEMTEGICHDTDSATKDTTVPALLGLDFTL